MDCTAQASDKLKYAAEANPNILLYNHSLHAPSSDGFFV